MEPESTQASEPSASTPPPPAPPTAPPTTQPVIIQTGPDRGLEILLPINRSGLSLVAGYLGLLSLLPLVGIVAIIVGCLAMYDFRKRPEHHGRGRAIFGIVMGLITTIAYGILFIKATT